MTFGFGFGSVLDKTWVLVRFVFAGFVFFPISSCYRLTCLMLFISACVYAAAVGTARGSVYLYWLNQIVVDDVASRLKVRVYQPF